MSALAAHRHDLRRLLAAPAPGAAVLVTFSAAAVGAGLGRALVTTYLPVLLERIDDAPGLIGTVMLVNTAAGFFVPLVVGVWSDRLRDAGHGRTFPSCSEAASWPPAGSPRWPWAMRAHTSPLRCSPRSHTSG